MEKFANLIKFLKSRRCDLPCVKIAESPGSGHGVYLDADLLGKADVDTYAPTILANISNSVLINGNTLFTYDKIVDVMRSCAFGDAEDHWFRFTERTSILILLAIYKAYRSHLGVLDMDEGLLAYIDTLPPLESFNNPTLWKESQLAWLEGTPMHSAVTSKQSRLMQEYDILTDTFFAKLNEYLSIEKCDSPFTLESFVWCDLVFWSRAISVNTNYYDDDDEEAETSSAGDEYPARSEFDTSVHLFPRLDLYLVPFVDFCNHATTPNVRWEVVKSTAFDSRVLSILLVTYSNVTLSANTQLNLSYGPKSNAELIFEHGFFLKDCLDAQEFFFPLFIGTKDEYRELKMGVILSNGLSPMIQLTHRRVNKFKESGEIRDLFSKDSLSAMLVSVISDVGLLTSLLEVENTSKLNKRCAELLPNVSSARPRILAEVKSACQQQYSALLQITIKPPKNASYRFEMASEYRKDLLKFLRFVLQVIEDGSGVTTTTTTKQKLTTPSFPTKKVTVRK